MANGRDKRTSVGASDQVTPTREMSWLRKNSWSSMPPPTRPSTPHWVHHDEAERVNQLLVEFFAPASVGKNR